MTLDLGAEQWITVGDAARRAQVDPSTVRRWADRGRVRSRVTPGGTRQIALSSLVVGFEERTSARVGLVGEPVASDPAAGVAHLAAQAAAWSRWRPSARVSAQVLERLLVDAVELRDALDDIIGVVEDELRDRAAGDLPA